MVWHLNALASLHSREWDGEWVVFDAGSGETHQMDTLTAVTLMALQATRMELPELLSRVADELCVPNGRDLADAVIVVLEQLTTAGLIEFTAP